MQVSWVSIVLLLAVFVVGPIASILLSKNRSQRNAVIAAFVALFVLWCIFLLTVEFSQQYSVIPFLAIASVFIPLVLYFAFMQMAAAKAATQGTDSMRTEITAQDEGLRRETSVSSAQRPQEVLAMGTLASKTDATVEKPAARPALRVPVLSPVSSQHQKSAAVGHSALREQAQPAERSQFAKPQEEQSVREEHSLTADSLYVEAQDAVEFVAVLEETAYFEQPAITHQEQPKDSYTPGSILEPAQVNEYEKEPEKEPEKVPEKVPEKEQAGSSVSYETCYAKAEALAKKHVWPIAALLYEESSQYAATPEEKLKAMFAAMSSYLKANKPGDVRRLAKQLQTEPDLTSAQTIKLNAILKMLS